MSYESTISASGNAPSTRACSRSNVGRCVGAMASMYRCTSASMALIFVAPRPSRVVSEARGRRGRARAEERLRLARQGDGALDDRVHDREEHEHDSFVIAAGRIDLAAVHAVGPADAHGVERIDDAPGDHTFVHEPFDLVVEGP